LIFVSSFLSNVFPTTNRWMGLDLFCKMFVIWSPKLKLYRRSNYPTKPTSPIMAVWKHKFKQIINFGEKKIIISHSIYFSYSFVARTNLFYCQQNKKIIISKIRSRLCFLICENFYFAWKNITLKRNFFIIYCKNF